ncbi:hypothetical protein JTE90_016708 [Oedothorax gibbosus]|uniref:Uncharacterized protein n=1 Tax=Oedothorax gibbosus TaxID=931172 RepID=A0AAV6V1I7_9ARAC|nr:hypothetical protein JTE90_016708 [Oedothorax gibbosus]
MHEERRWRAHHPSIHPDAEEQEDAAAASLTQDRKFFPIHPDVTTRKFLWEIPAGNLTHPLVFGKRGGGVLGPRGGWGLYCLGGGRKWTWKAPSLTSDFRLTIRRKDGMIQM